MKLKKVVAIVRKEKFDEIKTALVKEGLSGMTVTLVKGTCSEPRIMYWRGRKYVESFLPHIKLEIAVDELQMQRLVEIILGTARTGAVGDGNIFIEPLETAIRIRDGQKGKIALSAGKIVAMLPRREKGVFEELEHEQA
jgi:nitrogen regulatory protein P-II 1